MVIRLASQQELPLLVPLAQMFFEESSYPGRFQPERWQQTWTFLLEHQLGKILLAVEAGERIVGGLGFMVTPDHCTGDLTSTETFLYIQPESRGGYGLLKLLKRYYTEAVAMGAKQVLICRHRSSDPRLGKIYELLKYKPIDMYYGRTVT